MSVDLGLLQNLIKRDKHGYEEEFKLQHRHFLSELELFHQNPAVRSKTFTDLVGFISQVAPLFPAYLSDFPQQLCDLLEQHAQVLHSETRICVVKAMILLRNRDLLSPTILLPLFFKLFRVHDKALRNLIRGHIISDIRRVNKNRKNQKLNRTLQNFMSTILQDATDIAARHSIEVMVELYRKNIWNDERTVNVIAEACLSTNTKILVTALQFFLSATQVKDDDSDDDDEEEKRKKSAELQSLLHGHSKKTRKRQNKLKKLKSAVDKQKKRDSYLNPNFPALQLINDPQGFAEKLFGSLKRSSERFEVRVMVMNLISRLIACHKLLLLNFYPWLQRYLQPHQDNVTHILCILSQSVHELVDADSILPTVRVIANNFISDRCSVNAMTVGLNTIREICMRCPFAIDDTLLQDLVQYRKYKDKSVMMAAKSLVSLFREYNPHLLAKKDRGKDAAHTSTKAYGEFKPEETVDGLDLLQAHEAGELELSDDDLDFSESDSDHEERSTPKSSSTSTHSKGLSIFGLLEAEEEEAQEDDEDEDEDDKDEETNQDEGSSNLTNHPSEPENTSAPVSIAATRILTDADFRKIDALRMKQQLEKTNSKKRSRTDFESMSSEVTEEVDEARLLSFVKRRKLTREERLASVMEGREGRGEFGSKKKFRDTPTSKTNLEKKKNQPFMLQKQSKSVRSKSVRSISEKMAVRRNHVKHAISSDKRIRKK